MLFRQILHEDLGCASYVIADGGEAAVVDPKWRIEDYLELAHEHDFRIRHVLETHNHADHLSGHGRLAAATGATLHVSAQAGAEHDHEPLEEGMALELGDARITAVRTPGHRPEHLAFVVEDRSREEVPWLLLTGDSLFVGDVARPDLAVEPEEGSRGLHRSLARLLEHEGFVEVWPGHVGGSLCGGAGTRAAWVVEADADVVVLAASDADAVTLAWNLEAIGFRNLKGFVAGAIGAWQAAGLETESTPAIDPAELARRLRARDVILLDVREDDEWEEGHVEGSLHVPYHELRDGVPADLPRGEPLAVACSAGNRSSLAASLLRRAGLENVIHVTDGGVEDLLKGSSKPEAN